MTFKNLPRPQALAIAALLTLGALACTALLWHRPAPAGTDAGHEKQGEAGHEKHGEADQEKHGEADPDHADEGLVTLNTDQLQRSGITVATAASAALQAGETYTGEIRFNEDRTAHVVPRLAGVAESVAASLGQQVREGQVLAVLSSAGLSDQRSEWLTAQRRREAAQATFEREQRLWQDKVSAEQDYLQARTALREADIALDNARQKLAAVGAGTVGTAGGTAGGTAAGTAGAGLNRFEIRAPLSGTIVEKHLSRGEAVREDTSIFTVSDLGSVWAEFAVAPKDLALVRTGQRAIVSSSAFEAQQEGRIAYVAALLGEQTRTARVRVSLANPQGAWRPGLFVTVRVLGAAQPVALAVPAEAVQQVEGRPQVFLRVPQGFRAVPVKTGRTDGTHTEVLQGLKAGDAVASANAFVLKSELGKASAGHGH